MAESHAAAIRVQTLAREGAEVARHTSALSQERLVVQRLEMERQLCGESLTYLILDVALIRPNETRSAIRGEG
jgi:hypothetical protein